MSENEAEVKQDTSEKTTESEEQVWVSSLSSLRYGTWRWSI